jgi:uncharacterized protein (TIGR02996 family)
MNEEQGFLDAIKGRPEDLGLRLVYADWLDEHGDERSEYLRIDGELHKLIRALPRSELLSDRKVRQLQLRLKRLGETLDAAWVALFDALRPKFVRCNSCDRVISAKEAIATNPRTYRKLKKTRYCKTCYEDAVRSQFRRGFPSSGRERSSESLYHGGGDG